MRTFADVVGTALFHSLWQGAVLAFALLAALAALRHRSANARYVATCVALGLMAVLPVATAAVMYLRAGPADAFVRLLADSPPAATAAAWIASEGSQPTWVVTLQRWAVPIWSIGVLLCSLRLLGGSAHTIVLKRRSEPADADTLSMTTRLASRMGVARFVPVVISTRTHGPATIGWLRPIILLPPATLLGLTPQQLEAVLAHELAHIRRRDYLVNVLQMVVETLFFYHPAVWWASRRVRIERELCCDDLAVAACGDTLCYAQALTKIARLRVTAPAMAMGATSNSLVRRIERLLGTPPRRTQRSYWPALGAVMLVLSSGAFNITWLRAHAQAGDSLVYSGLWEMRPATMEGVTQLRLCYADLFSRAEIPLNRLDGLLPARMPAADGPVRFTLQRDAGTFNFDGSILRGIGTGTYTFTPAARVSEDLAARGFERPTSSLQHTLALHDIGLSTLDQLPVSADSQLDLQRAIRRAQVEALLGDLPGRFTSTTRTAGWC